MKSSTSWIKWNNFGSLFQGWRNARPTAGVFHAWSSGRRPPAIFSLRPCLCPPPPAPLSRHLGLNAAIWLPCSQLEQIYFYPMHWIPSGSVYTTTHTDKNTHTHTDMYTHTHTQILLQALQPGWDSHSDSDSDWDSDSCSSSSSGLAVRAGMFVLGNDRWRRKVFRYPFRFWGDLFLGLTPRYMAKAPLRPRPGPSSP